MDRGRDIEPVRQTVRDDQSERQRQNSIDREAGPEIERQRDPHTYIKRDSDRVRRNERYKRLAHTQHTCT